MLQILPEIFAIAPTVSEKIRKIANYRRRNSFSHGPVSKENMKNNGNIIRSFEFNKNQKNRKQLEYLQKKKMLIITRYTQSWKH